MFVDRRSRGVGAAAATVLLLVALMVTGRVAATSTSTLPGVLGAIAQWFSASPSTTSTAASADALLAPVPPPLSSSWPLPSSRIAPSEEVKALARARAAQYQTLVFSDDFHEFDTRVWRHEITAGGGGNWEFEYYTNNRTNSYVNSSVLYLRPTLTADHYGDDFVESGDLNLWGSVPASLCTGNQFYGCDRQGGGGGNIVNPVQSAAVRTAESFAFAYGKLEVRARLPRGDWLWPAIWLLPRDNQYGDWPASGEIDLMESRGNSAQSYPNPPGGCDTFGSTLHVGPGYPYDDWSANHAAYTLPNGADFTTDFHTFGLLWSDTELVTYLDDPSNVVLHVPFNTSFWQKGGWESSGMWNPWLGRNASAPFDREFYLIFNVAVGGTNSYFPDGVDGKPWTNADPHAVNAFWNTKAQWYPTWLDAPNSGADYALQIDWVNVYQ